jgi:hypothetical protein
MKSRNSVTAAIAVRSLPLVGTVRHALIPLQNGETDIATWHLMLRQLPLPQKQRSIRLRLPKEEPDSLLCDLQVNPRSTPERGSFIINSMRSSSHPADFSRSFSLTFSLPELKKHRYYFYSFHLRPIKKAPFL